MGLRPRPFTLCWRGAARKRCKNRVEQDRSIRTGATASVIAHLSLLALLVLLSEVRPLGSATEPVAVNIVTPDEAEPEQLKQEPGQDKPEPQLTLPDPTPPMAPPPAAQAAAPAAPPPASASQQAAKPQAVRPDRNAAAAAAALAATAVTPPAQPGPASADYRPAEPDLTVKYNVMLGLRMELPPPTGSRKSDEGFEEKTSNADISSTVIAEFRRSLKSCSKLPASVQPSDHIMVKLRVFMTQDGRLATDPMVGGGSANPRAIELLQSAIAGLKQCQPYKMLPADRYGEWKVLDLDFTPKDFSG
jgi:hypothetical protein